MVLILPRPQSLSKGGEENEKKFFVGRAKNNGKAKEREASLMEAFASHISISHHALPGKPSLPIFQYPIMHCPAMISQPLIYIVCNCTALCPTKGLRRRQVLINKHKF
jgi:hypothetical protein